MFHSQAPGGTSLPNFLRAWLLRVHKRILLSSATLHEVAPRLDDDRLPPAERLPDEIILQILGNLLPAGQNSSRPSSPTLPGNSATAATQALVRHQAHLLWACKTCRRWYAVGTEVLYMSPLLTTTKRMELFERTLSETPSLARFVQAIYAPIRAEGSASDLLGWIIGRRSSAAQREELSTMLQHCPSLRSLTIRHSVRKGVIARVPVPDVLQSPQLSERIENLSLHGSTFETRWNPQFCVIPALSSLLLPHLQVLCLRGMYVLPSIHLPVLPRLHTIQLIDNHYFGVGPFFLCESLPVLRTVEIVGHDVPEAQLGLLEMFEGRTLYHLETLRIMQDERPMMVTRTIPHDGRLRNLELGFLTPRDHTDMACWRIPDSLQSLTLVLRQNTVEGQCSLSDAKDCLDAILSCLRSNDEAKHLKEVNVIGRPLVASPERYEDDPTDDLVDKLRGICAPRGITLRVEPPSKRTSLIHCLIVKFAADCDELSLHASKSR